MLRVLGLIFLFGLLGGNFAGPNREVNQKIIGGQPISIKQRPFMLSLHSPNGFACGATILSRSWAITALHCFTSLSPKDYYVRAGSNDPNRDGTIHRLRKIRVYNATTHSDPFSGMFYHDVALFKVKPRFRFSKKVRAARLPKRNCGPPSILLASGWGVKSLDIDDEASDVLMGVYVQLVPFDSCVNATQDYRVIVDRENHLCYGSLGKDSCYGDSGGPLANENTIFGVVSFGRKCGEFPGVYVNVSNYRKWIKKVIRW